PFLWSRRNVRSWLPRHALFRSARRPTVSRLCGVHPDRGESSRCSPGRRKRLRSHRTRADVWVCREEIQDRLGTVTHRIWTQAALRERDPVGRGEAEVPPGARGRHATTRRPREQAGPDEVWLAHLFDGVRLLPNRYRERGEPNRAAAEGPDQSCQHRLAEPVQAEVI